MGIPFRARCALAQPSKKPPEGEHQVCSHRAGPKTVVEHECVCLLTLIFLVAVYLLI